MRLDPLRGGLESPGITHVRAFGRNGRPAGSFVVKLLTGRMRRERDIYEALERMQCGAVAPRLLGWRPVPGDSGYAFLEWVAAAGSWPWRNPVHAALVLRQLARLHSVDRCSATPAFGAWDYESELCASAGSTVELYGRLFREGFRIGTRPMLRTLERVREALPEMRRAVTAETGATLLHGDAHPGNAIVRRLDNAPPVLLDWGRARIGSPLEDVCSWLHSLGFWEPQARRLHDSLLAGYQAARGFPHSLSPSFRTLCWLAGASNAMAGALRYHLSVAADADRTGEQRWSSALAAGDWLRILRRADACWRG
jgi:aminoglycoside phosphotransferase (APT) family kinase protein